MTQKEVRKILEVGVLLSSERDPNRLLEEILSSVMELAHCDAGTLYLLEENALRFRILRNDTLKIFQGGDGTPPDLPPVPLTEENVCARAVLEGRPIQVADAAAGRDEKNAGSARYDRITGYRTHSMLAVPMRSRTGETLGVLQLLNAMDEEGRVRPFPDEMILMLESVASQAAIMIRNVRYIREIQEMFHSFVYTMASAIDARSPYNGSHTRHMVAYGEKFLTFLNERAAAQGQKAPFPPQRREEFLMSVWLHDLGKLVIPLEVMDKPARLLPAQRTAFFHRMELIRLLARLEGGAADETARLTREAEALVNALDDPNVTPFVTDENLQALEALAARSWRDEAGHAQPWLTQAERAMLSIRRGTLSDAERETVSFHAVMTDRLLSEIHFPPELSHVRAWAAAHHELLNGKGYPNHLSGDAIPEEVRILTILDIFDALTADDRPYKKAKPVPEALKILEKMAGAEGSLDARLVGLFAESRCWE